MIQLAGMDAIRWLRSPDMLEVRLTQLVANRVIELSQMLDRNRAILIANAVRKVFGG